MAGCKPPECRKCQRLQDQVAKLQERLAAIESQLAKARKHAGNSSKPPSSDITTPPKAKRTTSTKGPKRQRGGQPGHPRHQRQPFTQDEIDEILTYRYDRCPCCAGPLTALEAPPKIQQHIDIQELPLLVTEHRRVGQQCGQCHKVHYHPLTASLAKAGLAGPRLTALVGFLKGACHMSFAVIRKFFRDIVGVTLSRGLLGKLVGRVADSLHEPYEELLRLLPEQAYLNVDETGHKDNGARLWTWCFRASLFTLFKISPSRGSQVLVAVLGEEFNGILGCDYFSAYRKYMKDFGVLVQFCLAHFIRDVKFLAEHPNRHNRLYGQAILQQLRKLFAIIHRRDDYATEEGFRRALGRVRNDLIWQVMGESPHTQEALNLEARFDQHADSYFLFITTPGVEPTNNLAEQALRFVAIHRRLTQGTRSEAGQSWCERIWTVISTCAQQGRSVFAYLCAAVTTPLAGQSAPSLVPNTS